MRFNSIRFKISVLYVVILGVILIIYSSVLYYSLRYTLFSEIDYELITRAGEIKNIIHSSMDIIGHDEESFLFVLKKIVQVEGKNPFHDKIGESSKERLIKIGRFKPQGDFINFLGHDGKSIVHSPNINWKILYAFEREVKRIKNKEEIRFRNLRFSKDHIRVVIVPFSNENSTRYILQVGVSLNPIVDLLKSRLFYITVSISVILLLAVFLSRFFSASILKPVMEITTTAKNITHEHLSARVNAEHMDVEMRYLVDAFNDMITRLEESFKYIMEFSSHMAHELKTPLAIIVGESELLLKRKKDVDIKEYKKVVEIILDETSRMLKSINDLLLLIKLDCRPDVFKFEDIDLREFLDEIHKQGEILASRKEIRVTIRMSDKLLYVNGDRLHLRRLFFNLLDNAMKYTPKKGKIDLTIRSEGKNVIVDISDTGIGISDEDMPEIFNRFFRGEMKGTEDESGSGLGLSIALSIARLHKGEITVDSERGNGSTFHVILPLAKTTCM
ncbi:GHKL domain-containing protein [bacterium]|nr:GHKL domain-containing protein [bacterium]